MKNWIRTLLATVAVPLSMTAASGQAPATQGSDSTAKEPAQKTSWLARLTYNTPASAGLRYTEKPVGIEIVARREFGDGKVARTYAEGGLQVPLTGEPLGQSNEDFTVTNNIGSTKGEFHLAGGLAGIFADAGKKNGLDARALLFARENFIFAKLDNNNAPRTTAAFALGAGFSVRHANAFNVEASAQYGLGDRARIEQVFRDGQTTSQAAVTYNLAMGINLSVFKK